MTGLTLGDYFIALTSKNLPFRYYHLAEYWPSFYDNSRVSCETQILQMSKKKGVMKTTDTVRLQSGYPHELTKDRKNELISQGVKRDAVSSNLQVNIPKLTHSNLQNLLSTNKVMAFTTPDDSEFMRDVTVYDEQTHPKLVFCYVVSRRAQIITAWSELKPKQGHWKPRLPQRFQKLLCLQTKPLSN
jgi:hypothetical protein